MTSLVRPDDPKNPGFGSGVWADGSTIYPGAGNFSSCALVNPGVAIIRTSSPLGAGAFMSYGFTPQCFDNTSPQYYFKSSNIAWKTGDWTTIGGMTNAIVTPGYLYRIGRINVIAPNASVYQSIGRIVMGTLYYYKQGDAAESTSAGPYDVLVCN